MNSIQHFRPQSGILTLLLGTLVALFCLQMASNAQQQQQPNLTFGGSLLTICNGSVSKIDSLPDGKLLVIGDFTDIGGYICQGFAKLNANGTVDADFVCELDSRPKCVAVQPDGKILVGGRFYEIGGYRGPQPKLVRLHPDGRYDRSFAKLDLLGRVNCIGVQPDGKILLGGCIYSIAGLDVGSLARLNSDGSVDNGFQIKISNQKGLRLASVMELGVIPDGRILILGAFDEVNTRTMPGCAFLRPNGQLAAESLAGSKDEWRKALSDSLGGGWPDLHGLGDDAEIKCAGGISIKGWMVETQTSESTGGLLVSAKNESRDGYLIIRAKKQLQRRAPVQ